MFAGEQVDAGERGVGGTMNIDRIGLKAHPLAVGRKRLDLVEQNDRRSVRGVFGDGLLEELGDFLLALAERRTSEGVRIDLQELNFRRRQSAFATSFARPRASVVLPVPGGPDRRIKPVNRA